MHGPTIHLVCPLSNAFGGSEQRVADYFALLSPFADVTLWAEEEPVSEVARLPFRRLDSAKDQASDMERARVGAGLLGRSERAVDPFG